MRLSTCRCGGWGFVCRKCGKGRQRRLGRLDAACCYGHRAAACVGHVDSRHECDACGVIVDVPVHRYAHPSILPEGWQRHYLLGQPDAPAIDLCTACFTRLREAQAVALDGLLQKRETAP